VVFLVIGAGLVAVAGLGGVLLTGRRARKRELTAAAEAATHPHYCAGCDAEWPHAGRTCLYPWASTCPKCSGARPRADAAASGSRA
jgi:hypothetical protein